MSETRELLVEGHKGLTPTVFSTRQLKDILIDSYQISGSELSPQTLGMLARRLGFEKLPRSIKYKGLKHSLWTTLTGVPERIIRDQFVASMEGTVKETQIMDSIEKDY